jgi:hypothetical protein
MYRKVKQEDIDNIKLHKLLFQGGRAIVGEFTNVYHWSHSDQSPGDFLPPPVLG